MNWHLTWQDPVAIGAAFVLLWLAARSWRRRAPTGCSKCPARGRR